MSKRKMGRPRKVNGEKRNLGFNIRVNENEKKLIEEKAFSEGYSNPTAWGRDTLLAIAKKEK